ncbi:MAG: efflux RND transporter periplasmic adaptor subunit [Candidatus Eremiobacteraeota bacterium]|nr:efflux RND transporter periplasmic adaptor subunit [Candidatus Eremiobacteraeota bacterium]
MKRLFLRALALSALASALSSCGGGGSRTAQASASPSPPAVATVAARATTIYPTLELPGIIAPLQNVGLSSALSEPTTDVFVHEGDRVTRGEVLAQLATDDLEASLASALRTAASDEAKTAETGYTATLAFAQGGDAVHAAQAALLQAKYTAQGAQRELERDSALVRIGYGTQQTADEQRVTVATDEQAVRADEASVRSALANERVNGSLAGGLQASDIAAARTAAQAQFSAADQIRREIARATIRSPIDGYVVNRNLNPGEFPSGRQIFTVQEIDHVYAILDASSAEAFAIRDGAHATVTRSATPGVPVTPSDAGIPLPGTVVAVLGQATPGSTNFAVKVDVPNRTGILRSGMPVNARIALPGARGIAIPSTAFLDDTRTSVMIVSAGHAKTVTVSEKGTDGKQAIVVGVRAGTQVIADGTTGITSGQQVAARSTR